MNNVRDFKKYVCFCDMFGLNKNNPEVLKKYLLAKNILF